MFGIPDLIKCPACKGKVSSSAITCPHCGHNIRNSFKFVEFLLGISAIVLACIIFVVFLLFIEFFAGKDFHLPSSGAILIFVISLIISPVIVFSLYFRKQRKGFEKYEENER